MKLILSFDQKEADKVRNLMTDSMWQKVVVEFGERNSLVLEDGSQIEDSELIAKILEDSPSFIQVFKNAKTSFQKIKDNSFKGKRLLADSETINLRREICNSCPFKSRTFYGVTCNRCGCNIKAKTSFATEVCPENKW